MAAYKQSVAYTATFVMIDSSDHVSKKTGLTVTVNIAKAGGSFGAAGGTVTEIANGWYKVALTTTDTNSLGDLSFHCTATGADDTDFKDQIVAYDQTDSVRLGLTALPNAAAGGAAGLPLGDANGNVTPITADQGTAQAGASGTITLRSGASATNDLYKGAIVAIVSGTGAGQARTVAGYVGSTKVATVDWSWTTTPDNTSVYRVFFENQSALNSSLQVATTASDPWATALPGSYTAGQAGFIIGNGFQLVRQNTAQAGAAGSITLDASASATDNLYQHLVAFVVSGTGAGQARQILGYVGSTKVASVFPNWVVNPDSSSVFRLVAFAADNLGFDFTGITEANFPKAGPYAALLPNVGDSQDDGAGHLIVKRTTGTEHFRRTLTTDGSALPIKGQGVAS